MATSPRSELARPAPTRTAFVVEARVIRVAGADARAWLHDLVTTDVESLEPGRARPSLILTPTGRIRAAFHVASVGPDTFALIQREPAPTAIEVALAPYVLSSDVTLEPLATGVVSVPPGIPLPEAVGPVTAPSILGEGVDALVADLPATLAALAAAGISLGSTGGAERARIQAGRPRFGPDLDADSLPAEAGWDQPPVTDRAKGCFLGQEAVAKVANLGHPTRIVLLAVADAPLTAGEVVLDGDREVGLVTSADGSLGLVRVGWGARTSPLRTTSGAFLETRPVAPMVA